MSFQRILVPIDFSEDSLFAFQVALDHYAGKDKALVLVHVIDPHANEMNQGREMGSALIEERRRALTTLANSRRDLWGEVEALIESGKPADAIIAVAKAEHTDLVIMGSHGSSGLGHVLFGSTTYEVARKLKCSVMISKRAVG